MTTETTTMLSIIERATVSQEVDIAKMQALLDMQERIMIEQRKAAFNADYMAAKMKMPRILKSKAVAYEDKTTGKMKEAFKFSDYESIDKAIRPIETEYGFARQFTTEQRSDGGGVIVHARLLHKDGHYTEASIPVALDTSGGKNNIQAMGSSFSYGKRYTTTMLWDIVTEGEDDDGQSSENIPIDDAQFDNLMRLIGETETDIKKFCGHLKVESIRAITNKMYPKAVKDLMGKQKIMEAKNGSLL